LIRKRAQRMNSQITGLFVCAPGDGTFTGRKYSGRFSQQAAHPPPGTPGGVKLAQERGGGRNWSGDGGKGGQNGSGAQSASLPRRHGENGKGPGAAFSSTPRGLRAKKKIEGRGGPFLVPCPLLLGWGHNPLRFSSLPHRFSHPGVGGGGGGNAKTPKLLF